jgi:hypothetical protein
MFFDSSTHVCMDKVSIGWVGGNVCVVCVCDTAITTYYEVYE